LAALLLARLAPDELAVLDDTAAEYFNDPAAALRSDSGDTPLGSGIDVAMMTPYLLAASGAVLPVLGEIGKDIAQDLLKESATARIRRVFKRNPDEAPGPEALTPEQVDRVRQAVLSRCHAVGLPAAQAALISDATIGALHTRP
jgi:hypothetical protein